MSQLTCGVASTISQSGARTTAPARTAQKIRFSQPSVSSSTTSSKSFTALSAEAQVEQDEKVKATVDSGAMASSDHISPARIDVTSLQSFLGVGRSQLDAKPLARNVDSAQFSKLVEKLAADIVFLASSKSKFGNGKVQETLRSSVIEDLKLEVFKVSQFFIQILYLKNTTNWCVFFYLN